MQSELKGTSEGFRIGKTSLGAGFLHKNACFLAKSEGICIINRVTSYKRGGFQKPQCEIFLVSILKNAYLVRELTTKKKRAADELLFLHIRNSNCASTITKVWLLYYGCIANIMFVNYPP